MNANAKKFLRLIDKAQDILLAAEQVAWDEIRSHTDVTSEEANLGWEMQDIAHTLNWMIENEPSFNWEAIEEKAR